MTSKKALNAEIDRLNSVKHSLRNSGNDARDMLQEERGLNRTALKTISKLRGQVRAEVEFRSQLHEVVDYFLDRLKLADKYTLHSNAEGIEIEPELDIENLLADVRLATKRAEVSAARKRLGLKE